MNNYRIYTLPQKALLGTYQGNTPHEALAQLAARAGYESLEAMLSFCYEDPEADFLIVFV